jgi:chromate transporter
MPLSPPAHPAQSSQRQRLREVVLLFLKIGVTAFGGPAAHIAIMRDEVVDKRGWLDDQEFLDLLGATNLIPGPNSSEMAIHISFLRAGWPGLLLGGASFILPAFLIVLGLSWAYMTYGTTPSAAALLYGIKPVIIPIIFAALIKLGEKALKSWLTGLTGLLILILYLLDAYVPALELDNVLLLLGGGLLVTLIVVLKNRSAADKGMALVFPFMTGPLASLGAVISAAAAPFSYGVLFLTFLKIGAVLYGSGYTLFAFMQDDLVLRLGWLTEKELIDAIAIGQMTPGPLSSTATFIGFILGGLPGAVLATVGLYIPAFVVVALSNPLIPRIRKSLWAGAFLDGVNAAALGLMAGVTLQLAYAAFVIDPAFSPFDPGLLFDPLTLLIGGAASLALFRFKVSSPLLVVGGAVCGLLVVWLT